jgi:hypothetical protein
MNKGEILKGLNEVQHTLNKANAKLNSVVSDPIWDKSVHGELDDAITVLQTLGKSLEDLMTIQAKVLKKPR